MTHQTQFLTGAPIIMPAKHLFSLEFIALLIFAHSLLGGCAPPSKARPASYLETETGMEFVYIEAGSFIMGATNPQQVEALPQHKVTLPGFHASKYEVTFDQYDKFCDATNREKPSDNEWGRKNRPVINVSWLDAKAMAEWLSLKTGLPFALPSEAQWEFFARAGTSSDYWTGKKMPLGYAACSGCGIKGDAFMTVPVGSFPPNGWGLHDTAGNVAEWTADDFHENYQGAPSDGSSWTSPESPLKIYRGGAFSYVVEDLKSSVRDWGEKNSVKSDIGFRLVINSPQATLGIPTAPVK